MANTPSGKNGQNINTFFKAVPIQVMIMNVFLTLQLLFIIIIIKT